MAEETNWMDEVERVMRLHEEHGDETSVAEALGKSQPWVSNLLSIEVKTVDAVKDALRANKITKQTAIALAAIPEERQNGWLARLEKARTRKEENQVKRELKLAATGRIPRTTAMLEAQLKVARDYAGTDLDPQYLSGVQAGLMYALGLLHEIQVFAPDSIEWPSKPR